MKSLQPSRASRIGPALVVLGVIAAIAAAAPPRQPTAESVATTDAASPPERRPLSLAGR